jgi:hypothetical protein
MEARSERGEIGGEAVDHTEVGNLVCFNVGIPSNSDKEITSFLAEIVLNIA